MTEAWSVTEELQRIAEEALSSSLDAAVVLQPSSVIGGAIHGEIHPEKLDRSVPVILTHDSGTFELKLGDSTARYTHLPQEVGVFSGPSGFTAAVALRAIAVAWIDLQECKKKSAQREALSVDKSPGLMYLKSDRAGDPVDASQIVVTLEKWLF